MSVVGLSDHDLRRLHQVQLEMLCEFDRVCRLLGLNYQLGAGSLLGAVRHGGFIPWDDDVDVVMLRADYERLLREGPPLLDRRLFLQTWRSDPHFQACFAKLRRHGSTFREEGCQWSRQHHGIYIDIFPFDPVWPDHSWWGGLLAVVLLLRHLMHRLMALASHHQAARLASWRPAWQRWPGLLAHRLLTQVPPRLWMAIEAGLLRCLRLVPSPQVVCLVSGSIRKQRLQALARPVAEFEQTVMLEFEGLLFPATAAYRDALTRLYGDYQQLPTPELRRPRHPVVEFRLPELECDEPAASGPVRGGDTPKSAHTLRGLMGLAELVQKLPELIGNAVEANPGSGYAAIFAAMFLENLFPPIPSELIMPLGGFYVRSGQLSMVPVVLSGLLGTVLGALPWYGIGRLVNEERIEHWLERHGRWIGISAQELHRSRLWFNRHGTALVFWGRLIPGIRTLISVPAGIELMPLVPFLIWTTAGSLIWTLLLTLAGYALGEAYVNVEVWIEPVAKLIKVLLVVAVAAGAVWLGLRVWRRNRSSD